MHYYNWYALFQTPIYMHSGYLIWRYYIISGARTEVVSHTIVYVPSTILYFSFFYEVVILLIFKVVTYFLDFHKYYDAFWQFVPI